MQKEFTFFLALTLAFPSTLGWAGGGPLGIDTIRPKSDSGLYSRIDQTYLEYGSTAIVLGLGLYFGNEDRLGHTAWQATDAMVETAAASAILKPMFGRSRPSEGLGPDQWFHGARHKSFPSGEVSHITSVVTPFMLEYSREKPTVLLLGLLPVFDGVARLKSQAHWQTDVLAGVALGGAIGYFAHQQNTPWSVQILPNRLTVGYRKSF